MSQVHIVDFKERLNSDGEPFFVLELEGEMEAIKSNKTGRYYLSASRASITSTFTEERCKQLIGKQMPGSIKKVECEEYDFTIPESGEVIQLSHRYEFVPEGQMEDEVFERQNGTEKAHQI